MNKKHQFDAIVVLGANMKKDKKTGNWLLPAVIKEDPGKMVLGFTRPIAAKQALKENLASLFLVTGGMQTDDNGQKSSRAQVLADLMIEKYNIPMGKIRVIGTIGNTMGNAQDTVRYLEEHPDIIKLKRIAILTNDWQLPRARLFFENQEYFQKNLIKIVPLSVEKLLIRYSNKYVSFVKNNYSAPEMKHRLKMEERGIKDFKLGMYKSLNS